MGRPRKYATAAERQAAYRARLAKDQRWVLVDRSCLELIVANQERVREAICLAAASGDPLALRCRAASAQTCLEKLAVWFEGHAAPSNHTARRED